MIRKKSKYEWWYWVICIVLALLSISMVYPLVYTLSMSFSTAAASAEKGFHIYPKEVSLISYKMVFTGSNIGIGYINTIYRTVLGVIGAIIFTSAAAYALSRENMPHARFFNLMFLFTMLFDGGTVPNYLLMKNLHLIDNRLVYVLPMLISAYNLIIMRSFMKNDISPALPESAKIDGATEFTIFFKIILPISKPIIATVALWVAVGHWNAWLDGMLYINDTSKQVLANILQTIIQENQVGGMGATVMQNDMMGYTAKTLQCATIIVTILPILAVYPFVQKYFVKGIMLGAVKG